MVKSILLFIATVIAFPMACASGFGRVHEIFLAFAQIVAIIPGKGGSFIRVTYYRLTLDSVGPDCHIAFGSYFASAKASLGPHVGIGPYCVLSSVDLGEGANVAGSVHILDGPKTHLRDKQGCLTDAGRVSKRISVGQQAWICASSVIMANVGAFATVSAGSVVFQPVEEGTTVLGNPAKCIFRRRQTTTATA